MAKREKTENVIMTVNTFEIIHRIDEINARTINASES